MMKQKLVREVQLRGLAFVTSLCLAGEAYTHALLEAGRPTGWSSAGAAPQAMTLSHSNPCYGVPLACCCQGACKWTTELIITYKVQGDREVSE